MYIFKGKYLKNFLYESLMEYICITVEAKLFVNNLHLINESMSTPAVFSSSSFYFNSNAFH